MSEPNWSPKQKMNLAWTDLRHVVEKVGPVLCDLKFEVQTKYPSTLSESTWASILEAVRGVGLYAMLVNDGLSWKHIRIAYGLAHVDVTWDGASGEGLCLRLGMKEGRLSAGDPAVRKAVTEAMREAHGDRWTQHMLCDLICPAMESLGAELAASPCDPLNLTAAEWSRIVEGFKATGVEATLILGDEGRHHVQVEHKGATVDVSWSGGLYFRFDLALPHRPEIIRLTFPEDAEKTN